MKGNIAVIGGVDYSAVGNRTPDGFVVVKPLTVWLKLRSLYDTLVVTAKRSRRSLCDPNHKELYSLCSECLTMGDKVAVEIVALREIGKDRFSCKIICSCGGVKKIYTVADDFLDKITSPSTSGKNVSLAKSPTMRVPVFGSSALQ